MRKTRGTFFSAFLLVLVASDLSSAADSLVTWKGEVRVRGEIDGRDFRNRTPANLYALLRTRLGAEVRPTRDVTVFIQLQDARLFGQPLLPGPSNPTADIKNVDLHQGFLRFHNILIRGLSLTLGRMELTYGNERIVGAGDWGNTGRAFDGALVRFERDEHALDLFSADVVEFSVPPSPVTQTSVVGLGSEGFLLSGFNYANTVLRGQRFEAYVLHEWSHKGTSAAEIDLSRYTLGGLVKSTIGGVSLDAEGAYQIGEQEGMDIRAFLLAGRLGYTFEDFSLRSIVAGIDHFSGSPAGSMSIKAFSAPFATAHKFFGFMDYFTNIPLQTSDRGLQDIFLKIVVKPVDQFSLALAAHYFRLAQEYVGRRNLGQEVDLTILYSFNGNVSIEGGASGFRPEEVMEFWFGGNDIAWWGYGTVRVTF